MKKEDFKKGKIVYYYPNNGGVVQEMVIKDGILEHSTNRFGITRIEAYNEDYGTIEIELDYDKEKGYTPVYNNVFLNKLDAYFYALNFMESIISDAEIDRVNLMNGMMDEVMKLNKGK